jgi:serine/threonine-protein kinase
MAPEDPRTTEPAISEGDILCGRYRADYLIDRTENGVVVAATDVLRGDGVAIKMLASTREEADLLAARLRREAHVLAQLTSPHVVRVFDVAKHESSVCMIMELLQGSNLASLVRKRGPLPVDEAVGLILQACDALAEAHSLGIVHRDIKPQNMFAASRPDGTPILKVLDFGVSKQGGGMGLTVTGSTLGSPLYTALEQLRDASKVDGRADIWSLALVLYFLLCRRNAFDADNPVALMLRIATGAPTPLRERRPDVPPELEAIIQRCVEKDPNKRYQDVAELARALVPFGPPWAATFLGSIEARMARKPLASLPPVPSTAPPPASGAQGPARSSSPSIQDQVRSSSPAIQGPARSSSPPIQGPARSSSPAIQGHSPSGPPAARSSSPGVQGHGPPAPAGMPGQGSPSFPAIQGYGQPPAPVVYGAPQQAIPSAADAGRRRVRLALVAVAVLALAALAAGAALVLWARGV